MCRPSQFSIPMLQEMNEAYNNGMIMESLAKKYKVSFQTIQKNIWKPRKPSRQVKI